MRTYADGLPTLTMGLANFAPAPQPWDALLDRARLADETGIDRIIVVDHVVMGENIDAYDGGRFPTGPDGQWLEPMTTMAVIAGMTQHVRLSTGIILAALRRPVVFAKSAATLDVLSGGRLDLGVGVGWQQEEYAAAGLDFAERGRLLNETLELCRRFWTESPVDYRSDGLAFERVWCEPKPLQPGGVPMWVSGRLNRNVLDRLVRYADGWIPWGEWAGDVVHGIEVIRDAFNAAGRDWDGFEIRGHVACDDARRRLPRPRRDHGRRPRHGRRGHHRLHRVPATPRRPRRRARAAHRARRRVPRHRRPLVTRTRATSVTRGRRGGGSRASRP